MLLASAARICPEGYGIGETANPKLHLRQQDAGKNHSRLRVLRRRIAAPFSNSSYRVPILHISAALVPEPVWIHVNRPKLYASGFKCRGSLYISCVTEVIQETFRLPTRFLTLQITRDRWRDAARFCYCRWMH